MEGEEIEVKCCPFRMLGNRGRMTKIDYLSVSCIKEDCMFWDSKRKTCAIRVIAGALGKLTEALSEGRLRIF